MEIMKTIDKYISIDYRNCRTIETSGFFTNRKWTLYDFDMIFNRNALHPPKNLCRATPICLQARKYPHCWGDPSRVELTVPGRGPRIQTPKAG